MSIILDGKTFAQKINEQLKGKILDFKSRFSREVALAVIKVGNDPASTIYVNNKIKTCEYVGIKSLSFDLPEQSSEDEIISLIKTLNVDKNIDGILVQLPLPKHLNESKILNAINNEKDVDGFLPYNIGKLCLGNPNVIPCTPFGIIELLKYYKIDFCGKHAVVVGRSNIVGKPIAMLLLNENCTVTVCHSKTKNLKDICLTADILVVAIGKAEYIKKDMVKNGAVVVDVGINRTENGLKGDVDFENVEKEASFITPVPGGVGPTTIAMLMQNTYRCALKREENGI